jgi:hypothetical protein
MAEAVRPVKKKRKAKKSHTEGRGRLGIVGKAVVEKERGIFTVLRFCSC